MPPPPDKPAAEPDSETWRRIFPVSWEELHRHSKALAWRLVEMGPWTGIVAISRGGLVPAAIVARELELAVRSAHAAAEVDAGAAIRVGHGDLERDGGLRRLRVEDDLAAHRGDPHHPCARR